MKIVFFTTLFLTAISLKSSGQQRLDSSDFDRHRGKTKTLCDTVYSFRILSDTLTLVNLGAPYSNQKYMLAIKGRKIQLDWAHLQHKRICAIGTLEYYKSKPAIVVIEPNQIKFD